ncbi:hypothetical protein C7447_10566 [Tenacibaculum adriaticum]|uniref:CoA-binding domain-containing protein n=1 Tax=Tenacibaculum adriaticum TaxID=413713 RepID=A0A5S5DM98_9FLAO|nr:CoA-binding protein [Tenacibaculum adriaticum]TYP97053.1 hypothetical protein C7447_10566 [Tenacibaculum adriaticum]
MKNVTLVLGASQNPDRYANRAIHSLRKNNKEVVAVGLRIGTVMDVEIVTGTPAFKNIDTVTLYLNPQRQKEYYDYIISLQPRRVIFNPGTENMELMKLLRQQQIETEVACTLVLLSTNQY